MSEPATLWRFILAEALSDTPGYPVRRPTVSSLRRATYVLAQNLRFAQLNVIARSPEGTFIVDNTPNRLLVNAPHFWLRYRQVADTPELQELFERIE